MKILMLAQNRLDPRLGGPRVVMELASGLLALGCEVTLLGVDDLTRELGETSAHNRAHLSALYDQYLRMFASEYDVVDYDHGYLPFARNRYAPETLFVARSVLLQLHLRHMKIPASPEWKHRLGRWLKPWKHQWSLRRAVAFAERTLSEADCCNVSNQRDVQLLTKNYGFSADRLINLPFGIRRSTAESLSSAQPPENGRLELVMIGTFDYRKGCLDLVRIFRKVREQVPDARLTLLGAKGLFQDETSIRNRFHPSDRSTISIVMSYDPEELPSLLEGKSFGVFPSYLEGFGIGVVEMLAAGIPVVAYDAPGPESILDADALIETGDVKSFSGKLLEWGSESTAGQDARREAARRRAACFFWEDIAAATLKAYGDALEKHRNRRGVQH